MSKDTKGNLILTFTNDSEVNYSGHGLAYVQALVKHGTIYTDISWTRKKIKTLSGDLFINAGDSLIYFDDEIYFYNQDGGHRLRMKKGGKMPVDKDSRIILNGANNTIDPSTGGVNYSNEPFEESKRLQEISTLAKMFSDLVDRLVPKSREDSLAQTKIEEAVMWANAGIERNITKED